MIKTENLLFFYTYFREYVFSFLKFGEQYIYGEQITVLTLNVQNVSPLSKTCFSTIRPVKLRLDMRVTG